MQLALKVTFALRSRRLQTCLTSVHRLPHLPCHVCSTWLTKYFVWLYSSADAQSKRPCGGISVCSLTGTPAECCTPFILHGFPSSTTPAVLEEVSLFRLVFSAEACVHCLELAPKITFGFRSRRQACLTSVHRPPPLPCCACSTCLKKKLFYMATIFGGRTV